MPRIPRTHRCRLYSRSLVHLLLLAFTLPSATSCGSRSPAEKPKAVQPSTFPKLSIDEIAVSFEIIKQDATGLPEIIRVRFTNNSDRNGALELPGPVVGAPHGIFNTPTIAIFTMSGNALETDTSRIGTSEWLEAHAWNDESHGLLFLRSPSKDKWPKNASVVILASKESCSVDYPTEEFCMIGHGIAPQANANFRTCYQSGPIKTGLQVWMLLGDIEKFERLVSNVVVVPLTLPDTSKYQDEDTAEPPSKE